MEDASQVQKVRRALGLTQKELARHAGVSQSLIAKIEAGLVDPSYSNMTKILNALQSLRRKNEIKAKEIMMTRIISISPDDPIKKAIRKMKDHNISQLPVIVKKKPVGRITEMDILDALTRFVSPDSPIESIMDDEAPTISGDTGIEQISSLLKQYNFVMVSEKGKVVGVITKADLLTKAFR